MPSTQTVKKDICQAGNYLRSALVFLVALLFYFILFQNFFASNKPLGHDYYFFVPALIDGYIWFKNNGPLAIPWFTPSFCGGKVFFGDPQSIYFSLPQILSFFVNPVKAIYISHIVMASVGYWGMFFLCRRGFLLSPEGAWIAATVFFFNGFFIHRMLSGHITSQAFMLAPLIAYLLVAFGGSVYKARNEIFLSILIGLLIAYGLQSGLAFFIIPTALAVIGMLAMLALRRDDVFWPAIRRALPATVIALALCASKLVASIELLARFPHNTYLLPGFENFMEVLVVAFTALFLPSQQAFDLATPLWENIQWALMPHEMAFGVTLISFAVIFTGFYVSLRDAILKQDFYRWKAKKIAPLLILSSILILPLSLLYYSPEWNAIIKSLPILNSTVAPIRWLVVLVPLLAIWTGMAVERLNMRRKAVIACIIGIPFLTALEDRSYYHSQATFDASKILSFYDAVKHGEIDPGIKSIADARSPARNGKVAMDALTQGESPLQCYEPLYGYRLEKFQPKPLTEGSIMQDVGDGYLNIRNPACLLYPEENDCKTWDAFRHEQKEQVEQFSNYRPFNFKVSLIQRLANALSAITLMACVVILLIIGVALLIDHHKKPRLRQSTTESLEIYSA